VQAEDGIRDKLVTGVQTCALPICDLALVRGSPHFENSSLLEALLASLARRAAHGRPDRGPDAQDGCDELDPEHQRAHLRLRYREIGRASCRERVSNSRGAVGWRSI